MTGRSWSGSRSRRSGARPSFFDDNGPKGGRAMRCALTVRLPFRPSIRVERSAVTPRLAFDAAFAVLERQLERYRERDRDNKRHPKKYFAAQPRGGRGGAASAKAGAARIGEAAHGSACPS